MATICKENDSRMNTTAYCVPKPKLEEEAALDQGAIGGKIRSSHPPCVRVRIVMVEGLNLACESRGCRRNLRTSAPCQCDQDICRSDTRQKPHPIPNYQDKRRKYQKVRYYRNVGQYFQFRRFYLGGVFGQGYFSYMCFLFQRPLQPLRIVL